MGLGILALSELISLSLRFESLPVSPNPIWFGKLLPYSAFFLSIFLASLAAGIVVSWSRSRGGYGKRISSYDLPRMFWWWVLAHLSAFAAFACSSLLVLEGDLQSSHFATFWIAFWLGSGLLCGVFLLLAAIPAREWMRLFHKGWQLIFASFMIGTATVALGFLVSMGWAILRQPTFLVVEWLLQAFGEDIVSQPAEFLLGTKRFSVQIASGCSGQAGIGLMVVFAGVYLWSFRRTLRFPRAFVILPFAIFTIWIVNAVRIALLIMFGTHVSPQIALGGFHSQIGWLGFIAVALGIVVVTQHMPFFSCKIYLRSKVENQQIVNAAAKVEDRSKGIRQITGYLAPLMALLATMMLTRMFSSGFDWLYPVRFVGTGAVIWFFWRSSFNIFNLGPRFSWSAIGIGAAVFILWVGVELGVGEGEMGATIQESLAKMTGAWSTTWIIFRALGSVITVPIAEELAFRGYLLRRLLSTDFEKLSSPRFTWVSFLVSSFLFGALHGRWVVGTVAGMFYAWAMYRRRRVGDAILAHASTNALITIYVLVFGKWEFWA